MQDSINEAPTSPPAPLPAAKPLQPPNLGLDDVPEDMRGLLTREITNFREREQQNQAKADKERLQAINLLSRIGPATSASSHMIRKTSDPGAPKTASPKGPKAMSNNPSLRPQPPLRNNAASRVDPPSKPLAARIFGDSALTSPTSDSSVPRSLFSDSPHSVDLSSTSISAGSTSSLKPYRNLREASLPDYSYSPPSDPYANAPVLQPIPVQERARSLVRKLEQAFPHEWANFSNAASGQSIYSKQGSDAKVPKDGIWVFVDHSNVIYGFFEVRVSYELRELS